MDAEFTYIGAFLISSNRVSFKIENEIKNPGDSWTEYDLLTCKGTIVSEKEIRLTVTSKTRKTTTERTYLKVEGNTIQS